MSDCGTGTGKDYMKVDELRWKRMSVTLLEFKNGDEALARKMGIAISGNPAYKKSPFPGYS